MSYDIEVRKTKKKGRGVFALRTFKKNQIIERCPVLKLKPKERKHCEKSVLKYYMYPWRSLNDGAVVLGYGSIYNHSYSPNAKWVRDYTKDDMVYMAVQDIEKGEEILVDYNGPYEKEDIDWFDVEE